MQTVHIAILDVDNCASYDLNLVEAWRQNSAIKVHIYSDFDTLEVRGKRFFAKDSTLVGHIASAIKSLKDAKANAVKLLITPLKPTIKTLLTLLIAKWYDVECAGVGFDTAFVHTKRDFFYRWAYNHLLSHFVVHSRFAHTQLLPKYPKARFIKHGCTLETNAQPREMLRMKLKLDKAIYYLLFSVETIESHHGVDLLLETLCNHFHLIIVGTFANDSLKNSFELLVRELHVAQHITLWNDEATKMMLWGACDAIVFPFVQSYRNEYILEAMSHALPVIASDIPIHEELITHQFNGLLFEKGNVQSLKEVLNYFWEYKYLATDLPKEALKVIRDHYNWQETTKGYLKLIA
ncbi:MAG: hypothetical protein KU38_08355 [Sulfurovum sp. FS08-3]|nr:MAG: hypothetical protein KU38_08355 [Sulfurovum sp. FS08-3]